MLLTISLILTNTETHLKDVFKDGAGSNADIDFSRSTLSADLEGSDGCSVVEGLTKGLRKRLPPGSPEGRRTEKAPKRLLNTDASSLTPVTLDYRAALVEPRDPTKVSEAVSNDPSEQTVPLAQPKAPKKSKKKRRKGKSRWRDRLQNRIHIVLPGMDRLLHPWMMTHTCLRYLNLEVLKS